MTCIGSPYSVPGTVQRQGNEPRISFPHALEISPFYSVTRSRVDTWFAAKDVIPFERLTEFLASDYTMFTAMLHAGSSAEKLEKLSRYYTLWFAMEERAESLWGESGGVERTFVELCEFLETGRTSSRDPWVLAYVEAVEDLGLSPELRRLHSYWKMDWIEGEQRVARYGNTPQPEFMEDRHHTVGMMTALAVFTPYGLGIELAPGFSDLPLVHDLLWSLVRAASWQSDLLTLDAEEARGEYVNTVNVLTEHFGMTRDDAVVEIYRRFRHDVTEYFEKLGQVLDLTWDVSDLIKDTFCDGILACSSGFIGWNQVTERYVVRPEGFPGRLTGLGTAAAQLHALSSGRRSAHTRSPISVARSTQPTR